MQRSKSPTLQDVAREAGVSAMTVSVVINGARSATRVSEATRIRIEEAAARLRYRPNAAARAVRRRRMNTIGVVASLGSGQVNVYLLEVFSGILETAAQRGQNMTVFSLSDWVRDERQLLQYCDGRVDGMILVGSLLSPSLAEELLQATPFVTIHGNEPLAGIWNLDVDNEGGAYTMVRYLIEQGHRRILHLTGPLHLSGPQRRLAGYRHALEEAGIPFDEALVVEAGFDAVNGKETMARLLTQNAFDPLPTAVFCANDTSASGCMDALTEYGLRIPQDISVAGFDDALIARMTSPQLTTVRQPFRKLGARAVEILLSQIEADDRTGAETEETPPTEAHTENLEVELVVRGSVARLPQEAYADGS